MFKKQIEKSYPDDKGRFEPKMSKNPMTQREIREMRNVIREMAGKPPLRWYQGWL